MIDCFKFINAIFNCIHIQIIGMELTSTFPKVFQQYLFEFKKKIISFVLSYQKKKLVLIYTEIVVFKVRHIKNLDILS